MAHVEVCEGLDATVAGSELHLFKRLPSQLLGLWWALRDAVGRHILMPPTLPRPMGVMLRSCVLCLDVVCWPARDFLAGGK